MSTTLGIDVACRAAHQGSLAVEGRLVWTGRKFFTRPADLEKLWTDLDLDDAGELTVVLEPTRNAWIVLADWFRRRGARVVMVPTTQSADLRAYYSKHAKNGSTPRCWPGCPCCTPKDCGSSPATGRPTRCAG